MKKALQFMVFMLCASMPGMAQNALDNNNVDAAATITRGTTVLSGGGNLQISTVNFPTGSGAANLYTGYGKFISDNWCLSGSINLSGTWNQTPKTVAFAENAGVSAQYYLFASGRFAPFVFVSENYGLVQSKLESAIVNARLNTLYSGAGCSYFLTPYLAFTPQIAFYNSTFFDGNGSISRNIQSQNNIIFTAGMQWFITNACR